MDSDKNQPFDKDWSHSWYHRYINNLCFAILVSSIPRRESFQCQHIKPLLLSLSDSLWGVVPVASLLEMQWQKLSCILAPPGKATVEWYNLRLNSLPWNSLLAGVLIPLLSLQYTLIWKWSSGPGLANTYAWFALYYSRLFHRNQWVCLRD